MVGTSGGARLRGGRRRPWQVLGLNGSVQQQWCGGVVYWSGGVVGASGGARSWGGRGLTERTWVKCEEPRG